MVLENEIISGMLQKSSPGNVASGVAEINCVSEMLQFIAVLQKKEISRM